MEVTVKPEREDYIAFFNAYVFKTKLRIRVIVTFFLAMPLQALWIHFFGHDYSSNIRITTPAYFLSLLIVSTILLIIPYLFLLLKFTKKLNGDDALSELKKIILTNEGIRMISTLENSFRTYSSIKDLGLTSKCIYIVMFDQGIYVIPLRIFSTHKDVSNFYGIINEEWKKIKARGNYINPERLYNWGWFGLVPIWGCICGVILFYKGLIEYKDRKLAIIGANCIALTVCFLTFMNSDYMSNINRKQSLKAVNGDLNRIVQEIEYYKIKNGIYPDSLPQIIKDNKTEILYDFMAKHIAIPYHYKKIGNKYTLFSVGVDGIPFTDDDIYPTTGMNDTSKFGLIKARK